MNSGVGNSIEKHPQIVGNREKIKKNKIGSWCHLKVEEDAHHFDMDVGWFKESQWGGAKQIRATFVYKRVTYVTIFLKSEWLFFFFVCHTNGSVVLKSPTTRYSIWYGWNLISIFSITKLIHHLIFHKFLLPAIICEGWQLAIIIITDWYKSILLFHMCDFQYIPFFNHFCCVVFNCWYCCCYY